MFAVVMGGGVFMTSGEERGGGLRRNCSACRAVPRTAPGALPPRSPKTRSARLPFLDAARLGPPPRNRPTPLRTIPLPPNPPPPCPPPRRRIVERGEQRAPLG